LVVGKAQESLASTPLHESGKAPDAVDVFLSTSASRFRSHSQREVLAANDRRLATDAPRRSRLWHENGVVHSTAFC